MKPELGAGMDAQVASPHCPVIKLWFLLREMRAGGTVCPPQHSWGGIQASSCVWDSSAPLLPVQRVGGLKKQQGRIGIL